MKINILEKHQEGILQWIDCLMIILGIVGIIGGFVHSFLFPFQSLLALIFLSFLGMFFYFNYGIRKYFMWGILFIIFIVGIMIFVLLFPIQTQSLLQQLFTVIQFDYFLNFQNLFTNIHENSGILPILFVFIIGTPIVCLIVSLICQHRYSLLKICILILLFILPVIVRHPLERYTSYCFLFFVLYQFLFSWALQYQKKQLVLKTLTIMMLTVTLLFCSVFLEPNPLFNQSSSSVLSQINNWIDGGAFDSLFHGQNITGTSSDIDGKLPTNSVETSQGIALTVQAEIPFSSYLRGYSLASYQDNEWHPVRRTYEYSNSLTRYSHYLKATQNIATQSVEVKSTKKTKYQFVPYFPNFQNDVIDDSYYENIEGPMNIILKYPKEYSSDYNVLTPDRAYEKYVYEEYLDVPAQLQEHFHQFFEEQQIQYELMEYAQNTDTYQELVNEVKKLLFATAQYDLNAGALPADKDFLEYFLFENKKGSCTHFATAGALMLRYLGIPTRYVRGYLLRASDFKSGEAIIRNYRSHAWIEVYESGKGWVPFEMTPSSGGSDLSEVANMLDNIVNSANTPVSPNTPQRQPDTQQTPSQTPVDDTTDETPWYQGLIEYQDTIILMTSLIIVLILYRLMTKYYYLIKLKKYNHNQKIIYYYQRMTHILHFKGQISQEAVALAHKAKFSQHLIQDEELNQMKKDYELLVESVYKDLPFYQKLIFKYIYGYK